MAATTQSSPKPQNTLTAWWQKTSTRRLAYTYLLPAFIVMGIITFYPLFYQIWMSFTDYGIKNLRMDSAPPNVVGLQNYKDIFTGGLAAKVPNFNFYKLLFFNLFWTFSNVILHVTIGVLIAVLLNIRGLWFKGIYRTLYVLPMVLPSLVIAVVWRNMFDQDAGAINHVLAWFGSFFGMSEEMFRIRWLEQIAAPVPWLPFLPLSYFAVLITNVWLGWPFMTIVATGALQSIPHDLYEAASIDGANASQKFWGITVPLIRPAMVPAAMYGIILTFNQFNVIYFVSGGGPLRQTEIMVTTAFRLVNEQRLYGMAAAFSVLIFFVLLALTLATNRVTKATESYNV
ncbi:MAG TPA: sugar ABC transporter permease [Chloroflexi bacterium]|nr:sugar ABC transporter permease [Chloroflexota bacterium]